MNQRVTISESLQLLQAWGHVPELCCLLPPPLELSLFVNVLPDPAAQRNQAGLVAPTCCSQLQAAGQQSTTALAVAFTYQRQAHLSCLLLPAAAHRFGFQPSKQPTRPTCCCLLLPAAAHQSGF